MLIVWRLELSVLISVIIDRWTLEIWWDIEVDTDDNEEGWSTVEYHNNNHTDKIISNLIVDWMNISTRGAGMTPSSWIPVSRVRIIVTSLVCTLNTDWIKTCNSDKWSWTQEKTVKDSLHCLVLYSCQPSPACSGSGLFVSWVCLLSDGAACWSGWKIQFYCLSENVAASGSDLYLQLWVNMIRDFYSASRHDRAECWCLETVVSPSLNDHI